MPAVAKISIANRAEAARYPIRLIRCIRFDEVLVLQGPPLIGAIFALGTLDERNVLRLLALAIGSVCLIGHVFLLNDWCGILGALKDPRRAARLFVTNRVSRMQVGLLATAMLAVGLAVFAFLGSAPLLLALAVAGLSALYSAPPI